MSMFHWRTNPLMIHCIDHFASAPKFSEMVPPPFPASPGADAMVALMQGVLSKKAGKHKARVKKVGRSKVDEK